MRRIRVIPTLLLNSSGGLVKTVKFKKRTYIGDPINAVKIFNEKGVDELVLLDIDATAEGRSPNYEIIEDIASEAFMPIAYGGGIRTVDQMATLFRSGLEKIVISTAAQEKPELVREAAERFGSQSIMVCLNVKKSFLGKKQIYTSNEKVALKQTPVVAAIEAIKAGAGEILIYSIDRDGMYTGYDLKLLHNVAGAVDVPVIACGGARNIDDFGDAIKIAGCSAVAAGSMFVFQGPQRGILISYPDEPKLMAQLFNKR